MARLRTKVSIVATVPVLGAVLFWVSAGIWLTVWGPSWISNRLKLATGRDVQIERISTNFLNQIRIHRFRMDGNPSVRFDQIRLTLHPWELLNPIPTRQRFLIWHLNKGMINFRAN